MLDEHKRGYKKYFGRRMRYRNDLKLFKVYMKAEIIDKNTTIKALLIAEGGVDIDESILGRITTPASGPGAGLKSFFLRFDGHRMAGIKHDSRLKASLDGDGDHPRSRKGNRRRYVGNYVHCPGQAFITVSEVCIFDCRSCPVPLLGGSVQDLSDVERQFSRILNDPKLADKLEAISLTSGVEKSAPTRRPRRMATIIHALREKYDLPIGVSIYPTTNSTKLLKDAGADEIKYNVETMDRQLFAKNVPRALTRLDA